MQQWQIFVGWKSSNSRQNGGIILFWNVWIVEFVHFLFTSFENQRKKNNDKIQTKRMKKQASIIQFAFALKCHCCFCIQFCTFALFLFSNQERAISILIFKNNVAYIWFFLLVVELLQMNCFSNCEKIEHKC